MHLLCDPYLYPLPAVVVLNVADSRSKELLAHYCLPVGHLQPFHHYYHLELVQVSPPNKHTAVHNRLSFLSWGANILYTSIHFRGC